jgi:hypothetical protein
MPQRLVTCLLGRHRPKPTTARWSGTFHYGECRNCGRMIRKSGRGHWKRLDSLPIHNDETAA